MVNKRVTKKVIRAMFIRFALQVRNFPDRLFLGFEAEALSLPSTPASRH